MKKEEKMIEDEILTAHTDFPAFTPHASLL
jgi:hypothetical protein